MKKIKILLILVLLSIYSYSATKINFSKQLVVIYKVLDPLSVRVDTPEKMTVRKGNETFRYSQVVQSRTPLNVQISAPYNSRDEILDEIYGTAKLELRNRGEFELKELQNPNFKIKGKGFFGSAEDEYQINLPLYNATTPNMYQASAQIDAIFNSDKEEMLMGTYKGVLILDVTYGN